MRDLFVLFGHVTSNYWWRALCRKVVRGGRGERPENALRTPFIYKGVLTLTT
jgi:hypothetical protein